MEAAAHSKNGYGGVPKKVGQEYVSADKKAGKKPGPKRKASK